ncbi:MAG: hypothetical protein QOI47_1949, partial [Actinomycetota bacterium]|nr:hypothetical protein [Actinomycetota bacterium]
MRRLSVTFVLAALLACLAPGTAHADNVAITTQVLSGTRTITTATLTPLANVLRTASVTGTLAVTVTETATSGLAAWSVTTRLCGPSVATPTSPDCTAFPDKLVLATDSTKTIAGSNLDISGRGVTPVLGGGASTPVGGTQDLSTTRTVFDNTGQNPLTLYTGTYASTSTVSLTPPAAATPGVYSGFLVV